MKKAFTLIEMAIVLLIIGILMAATMRFGSGRIGDLKSQSNKEYFVGWYNELYSQNMTSSFRDGKKYERLGVVFESGISYQVDDRDLVNVSFDGIQFHNFLVDGEEMDTVSLGFVPYALGCSFGGIRFSFEIFVPENGKQYCFEIVAETCKLIEMRCNE